MKEKHEKTEKKIRELFDAGKITEAEMQELLDYIHFGRKMTDEKNFWYHLYNALASGGTK